jgi:hypothetical protein
MMLGVAAALVLAAGLWWMWIDPALEGSAKAQQQISVKEKQLGELMGLRARWDALQARRAAFEGKLGGRGKDFNITTSLQAAADRAQVAGKVKPGKDIPPSQEGRYRRRAAEVSLEGLTLDQLVNYLYEVEEPVGMLHIDRLEVKPQANPLFMDASLSVSTLETVTAGREAGGRDTGGRDVGPGSRDQAGTGGRERPAMPGRDQTGSGGRGPTGGGRDAARP